MLRRTYSPIAEIPTRSNAYYPISLYWRGRSPVSDRPIGGSAEAVGQAIKARDGRSVSPNEGKGCIPIDGPCWMRGSAGGIFEIRTVINKLLICPVEGFCIVIGLGVNISHRRILEGSPNWRPPWIIRRDRLHPPKPKRGIH